MHMLIALLFMFALRHADLFVLMGYQHARLIPQVLF